MGRATAIFALLAIAVLPYLPALGGELVYDDVALIDARVREGDLRAAIAEPYWRDAGAGLYRPVTTASLVVNARLLGASPAAFRVVNAALHGAAAVVALLLARRIVESERVAWLAAALFAAHPIHVEAVAQVGGRAETLAFVGGGLAWWLGRGASGRPARLALATLAALVALLSKESALALFPAAVLHAAAAPGPGERRAGACLRAAVPWAAALVPALAARVAVLGGELVPGQGEPILPLMNPLAQAPLELRLANVPVLATFYLRQLAAPAWLAWDYGARTLSLATTPLGVSVLSNTSVLLCLIGVAVWLDARRGGRAARVSLAAFALTLAPVLHVPRPIGTLAADRLAFTPSFAFACLAALALDALRPRLGPRPWRVAAAGLAGLLAWLAAALAPAWGDPARFYELGERRAPASAQVHLSRAFWRARRGEPRLAAAAFARAAELAPEEPVIALRLGQTLLELGAAPDAERALRRALSLAPRPPKRAEAFFSLALALSSQGRDDDARRALEQSVAVHPTYAALASLGVALAPSEPRRARELIEASLLLEPTQPKADELRALLRGLPR